MKILEDVLPFLIILIPVLNVVIKSLAKKEKEKNEKQTLSKHPEEVIEEDMLFAESASGITSQDEAALVSSKNVVSYRSRIAPVETMPVCPQGKVPVSDKNTFGKLFKDRSEIKRAIILSEILNRKHV
ncbi:MAG: hypothetical protein RR346_07925 [Bacteroidales bacterium]